MASATEGTIVHSQLTDPQLHEPKGISKASSGSVYFADGDGSGSWRIPSIADLAFIKGFIPSVSGITGTVPESLDVSLLTQSGVLKDAANLQEVNADIKILTTKINEIIALLMLLLKNGSDSTDAINRIRTSLINIGIFGD